MIGAMSQPLIPLALAPGATIGVIAPARWPDPEQLAQGKIWLEAQGFKVKLHPQLQKRDGRLAGDDKARAAAINDMFADKDVQAILCARGGTGSFRLLDAIDYDLVKRNPKIFCGFSDVTVLLLALQQRAGLTTFHGPMLRNFTREYNDPRTQEDLFTLLGGKIAAGGKSFASIGLMQGKTEGRLVGGNLSMLRDLLGTPYDWSGDRTILFFEDIDEPLYKLDHMLWQLRQAGKLKGLRGVIVGEMIPHSDDVTPEPGDIPYGKNLNDLLREYVPGGVPVCTNFPCGHGNYLTTLPLGTRAALEVAANQTTLRFLDPVVQGERNT